MAQVCLYSGEEKQPNLYNGLIDNIQRLVKDGIKAVLPGFDEAIIVIPHPANAKSRFGAAPDYDFLIDVEIEADCTDQQGNDIVDSISKTCHNFLEVQRGRALHGKTAAYYRVQLIPGIKRFAIARQTTMHSASRDT